MRPLANKVCTIRIYTESKRPGILHKITTELHLDFTDYVCLLCRRQFEAQQRLAIMSIAIMLSTKYLEDFPHTEHIDFTDYVSTASKATRGSTKANYNVICHQVMI